MILDIENSLFELIVLNNIFFLTVGRNNCGNNIPIKDDNSV